jgi:hypothetical protein
MQRRELGRLFMQARKSRVHLTDVDVRGAEEKGMVRAQLRTSADVSLPFSVRSL